MNSVNISGMLKNMLSQGFTTNHCLFELIDDSCGANATEIRIGYVIEKEEGNDIHKLFIIDNGIGMSKDKLKSSHILHSRSNVSDTKHGRFGIGRKHALVHFTQNKHSVTTLSQSYNEKSSKNELFELKIDFEDSIKENQLIISPHSISTVSEKIWNEYSINKDSTGTITIIDCEESLIKELIHTINTKEIEISVKYLIGMTYCKYIQSGNKISLCINGSSVNIPAIDTIHWNKSDAKNKYELSIYHDKDTKTNRAYLQKGDTYGCFDIDFSNKSKTKFNGSKPKPHEKYIGDIELISAYKENWHTIENSLFESMGLTVKENSINGEKGASGCQDFIEFLGGIFVSRNNKIIARFPPAIPKAGDHDKKPFFKKTRHFISFSPLNAETDDDYTLDNVFNIQINKSKIDEYAKEHHVWYVIRKLSDDFTYKTHNAYKQKLIEPEPVPSFIKPIPSSNEPTPSSIKPTPSPIKPTPSSIKPTPSSIKPTPSSIKPTPSSIKPTPSSIKPTPSPIKPTPSSIKPTPSPIKSITSPVKTENNQHKSNKDVIVQLQKLSEITKNINIDNINEIRNIECSNIYDNIKIITEYLNKSNIVTNILN